MTLLGPLSPHLHVGSRLTLHHLASPWELRHRLLEERKGPSGALVWLAHMSCGQTQVKAGVGGSGVLGWPGLVLCAWGLGSVHHQPHGESSPLREERKGTLSRQQSPSHSSRVVCEHCWCSWCGKRLPAIPESSLVVGKCSEWASYSFFPLEAPVEGQAGTDLPLTSVGLGTRADRGLHLWLRMEAF